MMALAESRSSEPVTPPSTSFTSSPSSPPVVSLFTLDTGGRIPDEDSEDVTANIKTKRKSTLSLI